MADIMYSDINIYLDIVNVEMFKDLQFRMNEVLYN
jgi:hypothetical protein